MNKKLIALAVAGATLAPVVAMAQSANPISLYGRAYGMVESVKASGGTATPIGSRIRVTDESSLFGIRGTEDIGGGLKALFQMETAFRLDSNNTTFAARNSGVGLEGGLGTLLAGRWDTPFKSGTISVDPWGDLTAGGITAVMNDRSNFDTRQQNVIQYWTPNWNGFQGKLSYGVNEGKTATVNPSAISWNATYAQGPFNVGYAWERRKDTFTSYAARATTNSAGSYEKGQALWATGTFGPLKASLLQEYFLKENKATTLNPKNGNISTMGALTYTAGKNQVSFAHQRATDRTNQIGVATAVANAKCKANVLGYFYNFSKRTTFVSQIAQVNNELTGQCDFGADRLGVAADQDPRALSLGVRHLF